MLLLLISLLTILILFSTELISILLLLLALMILYTKYLLEYFMLNLLMGFILFTIYIGAMMIMFGYVCAVIGSSGAPVSGGTKSLFLYSICCMLGLGVLKPFVGEEAYYTDLMNYYFVSVLFSKLLNLFFVVLFTMLMLLFMMTGNKLTNLGMFSEFK